MRIVVLLAALAVVTFAAADDAMSSRVAAPATVTAGNSDYGRILFDGRGFALYAFGRDRSGQSTCSGACAKAWPPFIVARRPQASRGARASLVGTTRRSDGRLQATYAGKPLYFYVGDRAPGQVLCQNVREFGGLWLVVRPSGTPMR